MRSYVESFMSIAQAVTEKTNLKVRVEEEKVRASADVPQHGQGWLRMPYY